MFAQLVITIVLTWLVAEMLCRLWLGRSAASALRVLFDPYAGEGSEPGTQAPHTDLRRLLRERKEQLESARARRDLAERTADVSEELTSVEQELSKLETRLDAIGRERPEQPHE